MVVLTKNQELKLIGEHGLRNNHEVRLSLKLSIAKLSTDAFCRSDVLLRCFIPTGVLGNNRM
jgi:hypothetical protein